MHTSLVAFFRATSVALVGASTSLSQQQAYVKASNTGAGDDFGVSVAVSGDTLVVGADAEDSGSSGNQADNSASSSGAVYVYVRSGGAWTQQAYLKASNIGASDQFGYAVAISGDTLVVGAPGESSSATGVNGNQSDNSAGSSGAVYVFVRGGTVWSQQAYLKASNTGSGDLFGLSVSLSGEILVVGAPGESSSTTGVNGNQADDSASGAGAAYVFVRSGSAWSQEAYIKASNTDGLDGFGHAVSVSVDTVVVGAFEESSNANGVNGNQADNSLIRSGAAYAFVRTGTNWNQQAYLKASNPGLDYQFGFAVAVAADTLVVGSLFEASNATGVNGNQSSNSAPDSGAAYIFARSGSTWSQQAYLKASNTEISDVFGICVAASSERVVVGASQESSSATGFNGNQADNSAGGSGAAYVFGRSGTTWTQRTYVKESNTGTGDAFASAVSVSGETLVVGSIREDSTAVGVNGNQASNSSLDSGAAYVFTLDTSSTAFCAGDGTGAACPCGNTGGPGHGCGSSAFATGAILSSTGVAGSSAATDTLVLIATDIPGPGLFFQSDGLAVSPINFGDGQLCAAVGIIRLGVVFPTAGIASYPGGLSPAPIHTAGAVSSGDIRHYQCWYRSVPGLCGANNYDLTQGLSIVWGL